MPRGTGFLVRDPVVGTDQAFVYLVTARHVVENVRAIGGALSLRVNTTDSNSVMIEMPLDNWLGHPNDDQGVGKEWLAPQNHPRIDVAACLVAAQTYRKFDVIFWNLLQESVVTNAVVAEHDLQPGDEVAITGLFRNHLGRQRNIPIVRSGMIAAMREELVDSPLGPLDAYLVEARSIGGLSGAPVFALSGLHRLSSRTNRVYDTGMNHTWLMGLIHGHFDLNTNDPWTGSPERLNQGIAIVTPYEYIEEVLHRTEFMDARRPFEDDMRRNASATMD